MEQLDYLIDRKITGSITVSESSQLDKLILDQPDLIKDIEKRYTISKAVQFAGNEELRTTLKQIHSEEFSKEKKSNVIKLSSLISIAAIIVMGILGYMFMMNNPLSEMSGNQAYATYYKPYKASFQSRGSDSVMSFDKFKSEYSNGNYKDALALVPDNTEIKDGEVLLSIGISALEEGDLMKAKDFLQIIIQRSDYFYKDHAKWYVAMAYLKEENINEAKVYLKELSADGEADHNNEAKELLAEIQ